MDDDERRFLLEMKANFQRYLTLIDDEILDYRSDDDDEEFIFLIKKAVEFRDLIKTVDDKLNDANRR